MTDEDNQVEELVRQCVIVKNEVFKLNSIYDKLQKQVAENTTTITRAQLHQASEIARAEISQKEDQKRILKIERAVKIYSLILIIGLILQFIIGLTFQLIKFI